MEKPAELVVDESKRDRRGRRITSAARISELLGAYDESGLTRAAFARRERVSVSTFAYWLKTRAQRCAAPHVAIGVKPVRFAEVRIPARPSYPPENGTLSVTLPDGLVVRGADAAHVAALVRALRA
jgi:hypothetical protein